MRPQVAKAALPSVVQSQIGNRKCRPSVTQALRHPQLLRPSVPCLSPGSAFLCALCVLPGRATAPAVARCGEGCAVSPPARHSLGDGGSAVHSALCILHSALCILHFLPPNPPFPPFSAFSAPSLAGLRPLPWPAAISAVKAVQFPCQRRGKIVINIKVCT